MVSSGGILTVNGLRRIFVDSHIPHDCLMNSSTSFFVTYPSGSPRALRSMSSLRSER